MVGKPTVDSDGDPPRILTAIFLAFAFAMWAISLLGLISHLYDSLLLTVLGISLVGGYVATHKLRRIKMGGALSVILLLLPLLALPLVTSGLPPYAWDEVAYSAGLPKLFAAARHFAYRPDYGPYSAFPSNFEALTTASLILTNSVIPMRVLGVLCFAATGCLAIYLARLIGVSQKTSWLAAFLVVAAPVGIYANYVKNDAANGLMQTAALVFLARLLSRPTMKDALLAAVFTGSALGLKYNSLQYLVCVLICFCPFAFFAEITRGKKIRLATAFFLVLSVVAAPWYVRNMVVLYDPVYPFLINWFSPASSAGQVEEAALLSEIFHGYQGYTIDHSTLGVYVTIMASGFGIATSGGAVVGFVLMATKAFRRPKAINSSIYFPAAFVCTFALAYTLVGYAYGGWLARYYLVILACFAAIATSGLEHIMDLGFASPRSKNWASRTVLAVVIISLGIATVARQRALTGWAVPFATRQISVHDFEAATVSYWNVAEWLNAHLSPCDRVAMGFDIQPFFYLNRAYYNVNPMSREVVTFTTPSDLLDRLRMLGITYIALQSWNGEIQYPRQFNPHMYGFFTRFESAVADLSASGQLQILDLMNSVGDKPVSIYRLTQGPKAGGCLPGPLP